MSGKLVFETYRPIDSYERGRLKDGEPSCMNGWVRVRRYRITVEEIEEPPEVIGQRIQTLWDESTNHHDIVPLRNAAKRAGWTLRGDRGSKAHRP